MANPAKSCCSPGPALDVTPEPRACCQPAPKPLAPPAPGLSLTDLKPGQTARIRHADLEADDAALLRAMGLRPSAMVRMCRAGEPCIIEVFPGGATSCACRIGLARPLADRVLCETETSVTHMAPAPL